jgi:hypothetical protein
MSTVEQRQEWRELAEGLHRNYQDEPAKAIVALCDEVDALEYKLCAVPPYMFWCLMARERGDKVMPSLGEWLDTREVTE